MTSGHLWHPWRARNWPLLAHEEELFVEELRNAADPGKKTLDRGDYSIVLNAIRCGLNLSDLLKNVPGARPGALLAAYERLDGERVKVISAWDKIAKDPTIDVFVENSACASTFFGLITARITSLPGELSERSFRISIENTIKEMTNVSAESLRIETELMSIVGPSPQGISLGRELYNPYSPGIWGSPYFTPLRVGALTPVRVRAILGESKG